MPRHVADQLITTRTQAHLQLAHLAPFTGLEDADGRAVEGFLVDRQAVGPEGQPPAACSNDDELVGVAPVVPYDQPDVTGRDPLQRRAAEVALGDPEGRRGTCRRLRR